GLALIGDISQQADVTHMVQRTLTTFGRIDILVNNAAVARGADRVPAIAFSEELFRRVLDVKVVGSFLLCKAIIPTLLQQNQGGRIINLSSVMGKRGVANTTAYCAANFAIQGFTQALAQELAPYRISVNAICPGTIDTARMDILGREELWQSIVDGRTFQCGEGWHSNEKTVRFWIPSPRVPKETDARCYAYTTPYTTMTPL